MAIKRAHYNKDGAVHAAGARHPRAFRQPEAVGLPEGGAVPPECVAVYSGQRPHLRFGLEKPFRHAVTGRIRGYQYFGAGSKVWYKVMTFCTPAVVLTTWVTDACSVGVSTPIT